MKKLKALLAIIAMSLIVGCGGGSSSSDPVAPIEPVDPMTERDLIVIFYHTPTGMCEDAEFQSLLKDSLASDGYVIDYYLFREETNNVSCATYDRANEITETGGCVTTDLVLEDPSFSVYDTSCVIGVDLDPTAQPLPKLTSTSSKTASKDTDIVSNITSVIQLW